MADSRIKSVSEILSTFFDKEIVSRAEGYASFSKAWRSIVGTRLSDHSRPIDIRHGILIVETDHQGWTQLLLLKQDKILKDIEEKFPTLEIRGLGFRLAKENNSIAINSKAATPETASSVSEIKANAVSGLVFSKENELPQDIKAIFSRIKKSD
jgi:hypothetical protein